MYVQFIGRVAGTPERKNSKNGNEYYQYRIVEETRFGGSDISTWYTIKDMTTSEQLKLPYNELKNYILTNKNQG